MIGIETIMGKNIEDAWAALTWVNNLTLIFELGTKLNLYAG